MSRLIMCSAARNLVREAEQAGFTVIRTGQGGHLKMRHTDGRLLVIPMHPHAYKGNREAGLVRSIRRTIAGAPSRGLAIIKSQPTPTAGKGPENGSLKAVAIAVMLSLGFLLAPPPAQAAVDVSFPVLNPAIFQLITMNSRTGQYIFYGTAWFFDDHGDAFTATHVVRAFLSTPEPSRLVAILPDGTERYATLLCQNQTILRAPQGLIGQDVAIVHVEDDSPPGRSVFNHLIVAEHTDEPLGQTPYIPLLNTTPNVLSMVSVVGYGWHGDIPHQRVERGTIREVSRTSADSTLILSIDFPTGSAPTKGDSGSPVLDAQGRAVGLFAWIDPQHPSTAYAVSTPDVGCTAKTGQI